MFLFDLLASFANAFSLKTTTLRGKIGLSLTFGLLIFVLACVQYVFDYDKDFMLFALLLGLATTAFFLICFWAETAYHKLRKTPTTALTMHTNTLPSDNTPTKEQGRH